MPPTSARLDVSALDRWTERVMRRGKIPGLSLGLVRKNRRVVDRGYGYRDRERKLPATSRTVYGIASMTKSFTALTVLRLQEHGLLRVRDPVVRYLPEFRTDEARWARRITLHHLLTHSSGLPPLPSIYYVSQRSLARDPPYDPEVARRVGIDPDHQPIDTYEGLMEYLATERYRSLAPPGELFSYSNEGFGLLGGVIERAAGRPYERVVEEEILRPVGMDRTTFDTGIMFRFPEVTTLYSPNWKRGKGPLVPSQEWWEDTCLRAAGALRTNVDDLLQYLNIYLNAGKVGRERVVSAESLREMLRPHIEIHPGSGSWYGYGITVRPDYHGTLLATHTGGLKGVSSVFAVLPGKGIGGTALANSDLAPSTRVLQGGINQLLGLPMNTPWVDMPPAGPMPASLTEYGGWYCSGEGIWLKVTPRRDHLRVDFHGIEVTMRGLRLRPHGHDGFLLRRGGETGWIPFHRNRAGRIESVHVGWRYVRRRDPRTLPRARHGRMVW